jgi:hypothetical protein
LKPLKRHLSVANAISCIALFVALSSAAYAATNLARSSVKAKHIASGAITTPKLHKSAVTTPKLRNGAVIASKISPGQVGSTQLGDGAVTGAKLGDGAVSGAKLSSGLLAQLVENVSYVSATPTVFDPVSPETMTVTAQCPAGKQVIGGGARVTGSGVTTVAITESIPALSADGKRTGWTATAREIAPEAKDWLIEAHAICAEL